ncbi:MAG: DUF4268 domain-containing protein [Chitinophagaceae bacterium]
MYTKQQVSLIRQKFWTAFGQYMRPVKGADGETINWINYRTGIKNIYFRMEADNKEASIAIEIDHADPITQQQYFGQLIQLKTILEEETGEEWEWAAQQENEQGNRISRVSKSISGVTIFNEADWPAIISFLKPRIMALDRFWGLVKETFQ